MTYSSAGVGLGCCGLGYGGLSCGGVWTEKTESELSGFGILLLGLSRPRPSLTLPVYPFLVPFQFPPSDHLFFPYSLYPVPCFLSRSLLPSRMIVGVFNIALPCFL